MDGAPAPPTAQRGRANKKTTAQKPGRMRQLKPNLIIRKIIMAGAVGFEPTLFGIKSRCLTAWPRPNKVI